VRGPRIASQALRGVTAPLRWLGPQSASSAASVERRTLVLIVVAMVVANLAGAIAVFAFANLLSAPDVADADRARIANAIAFVTYVSVALLIGIVWGTKWLRPLRGFLREEREPTPAERRMILRAPLRITLVNGVLWGVAAILFGGLNVSFSLELAIRVGSSVLLSGVITCAVSYLLSERLLRVATARALAAEVPERPAVPGVAARSLLAWMLGTGVLLLGLITIGVSTLVERDFTRDQLAVVILVLGGMAFVVGLLVVLLAARATADPIRSVRDALARVERGDLDAEVPVYDGSEVGLLQAGFNRMVEGLRERERIREAFGTYLDPGVAERVLREGPALEGEEVEVTLMFLDVQDFTGFAERSPAPEVVATINRLFELVVPVIHSHGGHVDKFVGDGLLAVFGAPRRDPEHAAHAVAAAEEIARAVKREFGDELKVGIGLNSGRVVAGNVGGGGRLEFSVIGDPVNVAARVEAATRETGDTILLSESTARLLGEDGYKLEPRSGIELKGKREKVALFAPGRN
jgi:adenylate cyclase